MEDEEVRALASDLGYLEAWSLAATGQPLPWPAPEALLIKFVAHHLWDLSKRETDRAHGMPADVAAALKSQGLLRSDGPHRSVQQASNYYNDAGRTLGRAARLIV